MMEDLKKKASTYTKFMMKKLNDLYKGKYHSPMQLPKDEKKKFFEIMDKSWKSKKES